MTASINQYPGPAAEETTFNSHRAEAFEGLMVDVLNHATLALMISLGHRSGLFDAMAGAPALTSGGLAERAGLQERYVREWLGAMVAGRIVEIDPAAGHYSLPAEHAAHLSRNAPVNLAVYAQFVPLLGSVEDDLLACFRDGGGVPYERYTRFHEVMAEDSAQTVLPALTDHILPLAPGLTERLVAGIRVLDAGCGRGRALLQMAREYPRSRFTGYDLSPDAIAWASGEAREAGLGNLTFAARDLSNFDETADAEAFDLVTTFDAVHDQAHPLRMLKGIRRSLANGGLYLAQDIKGSSHHHQDRDHPLGPLLYSISCMHCMAVSLAQGGEGLGAMWGCETAERYFREAGFGQVEVHELEHDIQNYYYLCRA